MRCIGENFVNLASLCDLSKTFLEFKNSQECFRIPLNETVFGKFDAMRTVLTSTMTIKESDINYDENERLAPKYWDAYGHLMLQVCSMLQPGTYSVFELAIMYVLAHGLENPVDADAYDPSDEFDYMTASLIMPDGIPYELALPDTLKTLAPSSAYVTLRSVTRNPYIDFNEAVGAGKFNCVPPCVLQILSNHLKDTGCIYYDNMDTLPVFFVAVNAVLNIPAMMALKNLDERVENGVFDIKGRKYAVGFCQPVCLVTVFDVETHQMIDFESNDVPAELKDDAPAY